MCGIAGVVEPHGRTREELHQRASAMGGAVAHRGPDAHDVWCDEGSGVALAHQRLAIIDLSEHGAQPMHSADGRWVLSFNGEIYNHPEIAKRLGGDGVRLRGHSDTEVLLEAIAHWSLERTLPLVNGMFAFALWDRQERTLTLARDRLGEKPLYYALVGRSFIFASEMRALRRFPGFDPSIDRRALALYVRHSFVAGEHAIYEGVRRLPAGCVLTHRPEADEVAEPAPYWRLTDVTRAGRDQRSRRWSDSEIHDQVERVADLLQDAVRMRMVSDVPLGAFLSGGTDSSLVVALMQRASSAPVRTFTMSVGGSGDEAVHAAAVAAHLGTDHLRIDLSDADALRLATDVAHRYDEPFADPSALPTLLLCAATRSHVKVCLTGDGGDEVAAGYNRYRAAEGALRRLASSPPWVRSPVSRTLLQIPPARIDAALARFPGLGHVPDVGTKMHKTARLLAAGSGHDAYRALTTFVDPAAVLVTPTEHPTVAESPDGILAEDDALHLMLLLDQLITLPDDMLVKVDRASMQVGLECRVPLLDHRLVELLWASPGALKRRDGTGKWVFRRVLDDLVPRELVERPKQGFDPPLAAWLRGPLREWVQDLLHPDRLRRQGLLDPAAVTAMVAEHQSGRRNHDYGIWTLATFEAWLEAEEGCPSRSS